MLTNNILRKVYVITGTNKGIGFGIIEKLCEKLSKDLNNKSIIYATSRQKKLGQESIQKIVDKYPSVKNQLLYHQLDISNNESISTFINYIKNNNIKVDILINNAAIIGENKSSDTAREVLKTNYHGTVNLTENLIPYINQYGHIINVSSLLGTFMEISGKLKKRFDKDDITTEELDTLEKEYYKAYDSNKEFELGWVNNQEWARINHYSISKIFLNCYSRELAWRLLEKRIRVNAFTPGWCKTDMGGPNAPENISYGVQNTLFMCELKDNDDWTKSYCKFYKDSNVSNW